MGGEETSASSILKNVLTPLGYGKPPQKICEDIGKISDICNIKYGKFTHKYLLTCDSLVNITIQGVQRPGKQETSRIFFVSNL